MVLFNKEELKKKLDDLRHYRGFLPFQFDTYVDTLERKEWLQKEGLWADVHKQNLVVMQGIRDNKPNDDIYLDKILKEWINANPEFKDLIIEY